MTNHKKLKSLSPIPAVVEVSPDEPHKTLKSSGAVTPLDLDGRYFKEEPGKDCSFEEEEPFDEGTEQSHRIGITRPLYESPADSEGLPLSPLNLYLEKKAAPPTPSLVELDSEDSADRFSPNTQQQQHRNVESASRGGQEDDEIADDDSIERMVHQKTADGHYLVNKPTVSAPSDDVQFNLDKGRKGLSRAMRRASVKHIDRPPRQPLESPATRHGSADASFKVFVLLLNPKAKIFELIQVIYAATEATIGDILNMIPANATEPNLGKQTYVGLCRPKDGVEITDLQLMASGSHCKKSCARITRGEILVAISTGFTGKQCADLAVPILKNKNIVKLLERSNPLSKSNRKLKRRSSKGSRSSRSSRRSSSRRVETVKEEPEEEAKHSMSPSRREQEARSPSRRQVKQAMKHAVQAAQEANDAVLYKQHSVHKHKSSVERSNTPRLFKHNHTVERSNYSSSRWKSSNVSTTMTLDSGVDNSLNDSYTAASGSVASNASSYQNSVFTVQSTSSRRLPKHRLRRRKHVRSARMAFASRLSAVAMIVTVGVYYMDAPRNRNDMEQVFGWMGLVQVFLCLAAIMKLQRIKQGADATNCPVVRAAVDIAAHVQERMTLSRDE